MRQRDLAVLVLQHIGISALQDPRRTAAKTHCMLAQFSAASAGFDANEADLAVLKEFVKCADGVRAASDAGDDGGGQTTLFGQDLLLHFDTNDALEIAHHGRSEEHTSELQSP